MDVPKSCFQVGEQNEQFNSAHEKLASFTDLFTSQSLTRLMYIFLHLQL